MEDFSPTVYDGLRLMIVTAYTFVKSDINGMLEILLMRNPL